MINAFYNRLFRQNERVMKFGLAAISAALSREPGLCCYPHISVAGTNGKGQVSALLANAAYLLGLRTGLFTSPHLVDFRERMRIDGTMVPEDELAKMGMQILAEYGGDPVPEFSGITLTYFECCLMMALRLFKAHAVEFGIFEVGLGGRLDATNALNPAMTVITSISLDHEEYLGHTTAEIAREKAGMMRQGCPVIAGRQETEVLKAEALNRGCSSFDALGHEFDWRNHQGRIELVTPNEVIPLPGAETLVDYQRDNAAVAAFALIKAEEIGLLPHGVRDILKSLILHTRWVGRMWPCTKSTAKRYGVSDIIMDGAHNPDGVRAFCHAVSATNSQSPKALIVNSCRDKALEQMFPQYLKIFERHKLFVVPVQHTERACKPEEYCQRLGLNPIQACHSLEEGLQRAAESVGSKGTIYISGSLYLIGEAIQVLDEKKSLETIFI